MPSVDLAVTLFAGNLTLRLPRMDDVARITQLRQDEEIARWTRVPSPYTSQHAEQFVSFARAEAEKGAGAHLCVCDQDDLIIGSCGLLQIDWSDLVAEVGYWVGADARGRGVATASARAVCEWAFQELGMERLQLHAAALNAASNAVARALGFVLEGTERQGAIVGHTGRMGSTRVDLHLYGLLPGELTPPASDPISPA
ncbi:MAG: GNAT family N-acetyltransferase [Actinomycetota bacterium]|nr:GNAT family N-acetyltransferase [Actinomycetota bacterium]